MDSANNSDVKVEVGDVAKPLLRTKYARPAGEEFDYVLVYEEEEDKDNESGEKAQDLEEEETKDNESRGKAKDLEEMRIKFEESLKSAGLKLERREQRNALRLMVSLCVRSFHVASIWNFLKRDSLHISSNNLLDECEKYLGKEIILPLTKIYLVWL